MSTVWVRPPYRPAGLYFGFDAQKLVNPQTIGQSAKMIIRPAVGAHFSLDCLDDSGSCGRCIRGIWHLDGGTESGF